MRCGVADVFRVDGRIFRFQHEIDESVRPFDIFGGLGDDDVVEPEIGAFLRDYVMKIFIFPKHLAGLTRESHGDGRFLLDHIHFNFIGNDRFDIRGDTF
ncbi:hypothetical protein SDC9_96715 [bioreactor metagenome]|uniref:Uncharacterized protein n=1 Tax=bioreactor metagenome TaxID=1076179 RepID=A0A645ACH6_9ZZZZ